MTSIDKVHAPDIFNGMAIHNSPTFEFFQGDTFIASGLYRTADGVPVDLSTAGVQIEAWVSSRDGRRFPIEVTFSDEVGRYDLFASRNETAKWPLGRNQLFIRYTVNDIRRTAHPVIVNVRPN